MVKKTQDNSKKLLLNAFGKQPRYVWLYRDGAEVQISLDQLQPLNVIVVNTGEVVRVDGIIAQGIAMIDQIEAEKRHQLELRQSYALERKTV